MRDVAIVAFAQARNVPRFEGNEIELLQPVCAEAVAESGIARADMGFTTLGSNDFLAGQAFSFVRALDAVGAYPVIDDSHLDMDAAWALYEAWVRLQVGDVDSAFVYGLGKTSAGKLHEIRPLELDPYTLAPLAPDPHSLAALQAEAMWHADTLDQVALDNVTALSQRDAAANPAAIVRGSGDPAALAHSPLVATPLRACDCPPVTDGAAAIVLAAGDLARKVCERPVWLTGIDHRIDSHALGGRDLARAPSARLASQKALAMADAGHAERTGRPGPAIGVAELHAQYAHEVPLLRGELALPTAARINASGGPLAANPVMATGLIRIGEAFRAVQRGEAERALAHATSGPCLQQNLVAILDSAEATHATHGTEAGRA